MTLPADLGFRIFFRRCRISVFPDTFCELCKKIKMMPPCFIACYYSLQEFQIILKYLFLLNTLVNSCLHLFFIKVLRDPSGTNMVELQIAIYCYILLNIDIFDMLVDAAIFLHVICRFSCKIAHTILTFRSLAALSSQLGLEANFGGKHFFFFFKLPCFCKNRRLTEIFVFLSFFH